MYMLIANLSDLGTRYKIENNYALLALTDQTDNEIEVNKAIKKNY